MSTQIHSNLGAALAVQPQPLRLFRQRECIRIAIRADQGIRRLGVGRRAERIESIGLLGRQQSLRHVALRSHDVGHGDQCYLIVRSRVQKLSREQGRASRIPIGK